MEYFEQVTKVGDEREANINFVGGFRIPVMGELNKFAILIRVVVD